jgi:hypothetical protein
MFVGLVIAEFFSGFAWCDRETRMRFIHCFGKARAAVTKIF